jgi:hypothetical protein
MVKKHDIPNYVNLWDDFFLSQGFKKESVSHNGITKMLYTNTSLVGDEHISLINKIFNSKVGLSTCVKAFKNYCSGLGETLKCKESKTDPDFLDAFREYGHIVIPHIFPKIYADLVFFHKIGVETENLTRIILEDKGYICHKPHIFDDFEGIDLLAAKNDKTYKVQVKSFSTISRKDLNEIHFKGKPSGLQKLKNVDLFFMFDRYTKDDKNFYQTCYLIDTSSIEDIKEIERNSFIMYISKDVLNTLSEEKMKLLKQKDEVKKKDSDMNINPLF